MAGSGIFGTFGVGVESTWATAVAPTRFFPFDKEGFQSKKGIMQAKSLHGGFFNLASRRAYVKKGAIGSIDAHLFDRTLGLLFKQMFGAVAITGSSGVGYTQVYTSADTTGLSFTTQVGRPMTNNSTIQAITYPGCKVTEWTLGVKAGEFSTFSVTIDSQQEETAPSYTAPSYVTSNMLVAAEASLIIGGAASTTSSVTSVSGGTTNVVCRNATIKVKNALDTDRFFLGTITKSEQLPNDVREITGSLTLDFQDLTTVYTAFAADTSVALQINLQGPIMSGTSNNSGINIIIPSVWWDENKFPVTGPEIIKQEITFEGLDDGTNNPIQLTYITLDSAP
jgi:hypothetical protein